MSNRAIQNIFSAYEDQLDKTPQPLKNRKAIYAIAHCRTREMGVSRFACEDNHEVVEQFHSCRNRSCFLCAQQKRHEWIESQKERLLDTAHFHVVFTLPHEYLSLWRYNEALFINIIFQASRDTLLDLIGTAKYGGVTPGILMVLHTWGRSLSLHPHTHCVVSAGGLTKDDQWKALGDYLVPSEVIRKVYRGKLQELILNSYRSGDLKLPPDMSVNDFWVKYRSLYKKDWCVRIEEKYDHGEGVVVYLAKYCKGGAINPEQIRSADHKGIQFNYLDHRDKKKKVMSLKPKEFIARVLDHVPPQGVHTIRYYGLYAPAAKAKHAICKETVGVVGSSQILGSRVKETMVLYCKKCGKPTRLSSMSWRAPKGNSINRVAQKHRAGDYVQQGDESDNASEPLSQRRGYLTG